MRDINIKKILQKLSFIKKGEYRSISSKVHHDWKIMLITFFVLWVFIIILSTFFFSEISKGEIFTNQSNPTDAKLILDTKSLNDTVTLFESRIQNINDVKTQKMSIPDPSL
jgi:hypothetical protein